MFDLKKYIFVLLFAIPVDCCWAQIGANGNNSIAQMTGRRVMQTFDFEETHGLPIPMYWKKSPFKPGFPHFSIGKLDDNHSRSGKMSFSLIGDGGSIAFEYGQKRIRVKPGSDCTISGYVHLENSDNCRAQIRCALTTRNGQIIPGSENVSQLISTDDQGRDGWALMEAYVPGNFPEARYLHLSVWLLQEEQWNKEGVSVSRVFQNNIDAVAWFDDISIFQLPRVILRSISAGNVFDSDNPATLVVEVDGVTTLDYRIQLDIFNLYEQPVFNEEWMLAIAEGQISERKIPVDSLGPGWYIAKLNIISYETQIAQRSLKFCILAELQNNIARGNGFGISLLNKDIGDLDTAIKLAQMLKIERVKIPVWHKTPEIPGAFMTEKQFERKLRELKKSHIEVIAAFDDMPNSLAQKFDINSRSAIDVFSQKTELWQDHINELMAKYARGVMVWQIGTGKENKNWDIRTKSVLEKLRTEFPQMFNESILISPIDSAIDIKSGAAGTEYIALNISETIAPKNIAEYIKDFNDRGFTHIWAAIKPLSRDIYDKEDVLVDFAKRIIFAKKADAEMIFIDQPWHQTNRNGRDEIEPDEFFPIFRTIALELGAMTYTGQFEFAPGINALIFNRDGKGTIAIWDELYDYHKEPQGKDIELYLGQNIKAIDIFGDRHPFTNINGITKINLKGYPVLISNIDSRIAQLRADIKLTPEALEATAARQQVNLSFKNPFGVPISGQIILGPGRHMKRNWAFDPQTINFTLSRDGVLDQPIYVKIPANEVGGEKSFQAHIIVEADKSYRFKVEIPFEIKLTGINVAIFTKRINQNDLLIQQVITNETDEPITMRSFVDYPDMDHIEKSISGLEPNGTITKNYVVPNATEWLGQYIRIGLYDPKGTRRINYRVLIN
ncbi:MAG: hypothetical protein JEZ07_06295 [Phycisphaerae bacterium]|nr:hypothetical protein [Phycisphaerae bacterium]